MFGLLSLFSTDVLENLKKIGKYRLFISKIYIYISHPDYFFDKVEKSFPTQRLYNHTLNDVYRIHVSEITSYFKKPVLYDMFAITLTLDKYRSEYLFQLFIE